MEILKLIFVILLIALLLWKKVDIGIALLAGAAALGFLFAMPALTILKSSLKAVTDWKTIEVVLAVVFIAMMGRLMKINGSLETMTENLDHLIRDRRISMVVPPALIGLLPTPGGAMLSAPMVEVSGGKLSLNPEQKTYINYWFRHLWEYWWPLYPGLIVAAAILNIPIQEMIKVQYPLTIPAIIAGAIFGLIPIKNGKNSDRHLLSSRRALYKFFTSIWPIWIILIGMVFLKIQIIIILSSITILLFILTKANNIEKFEIIKTSFSWKISLVLVSVMIFKQILLDSPAVAAIPALIEESGVSPLIPIALIPFIMGILTGVNQAYIAVSFPFLLPFFGVEHYDLKLIMFAYTVGFIGVLLSPVHLCLLLTKEYFNANWKGIYKPLIPSSLIILIAAIILLKF